MIFSRCCFCIVTTSLLSSCFSVNAQNISRIGIVNKNGIQANQILFNDSTSVTFSDAKPLFSFRINEELFYSTDKEAVKADDKFLQVYPRNLRVTNTVFKEYIYGLKSEILFKNGGSDTIKLSGLVPFGEGNSSIYITSKPPYGIASAFLFRPEHNPLKVILPDNAWELGYSSFNTGKGFSICALARRTENSGALLSRYETLLPPGSSVVYTVYADIFKGEWQNGLKLMFGERYLYDLNQFDNSLYSRPDLEWIRKSYIVVLQMAWDREFYDRFTGKFTYPEVIRKGIDLFGNIDVYGLWSTWPRLGLDDRNQWNMYRDLPGGTQQLRSFIKMSQQAGTKFFIGYNPWDNSTRVEDHYMGMAKLLKETEADGVILDTKGNSSKELQSSVDSVKSGVILYSEGMAVPKDMQGIISGRVHNAIYLSPELNLNKLIKPDFSIFRVCDIGEDAIHREIAISFFNGYGTELNLFRPGGRDDDYIKDLEFLSKTTFNLRQNNKAFLDKDWTPLITTTLDDVFVNRWVFNEKTIYTILNMRFEGYEGNLFRINDFEGKHFVSLWSHDNILPVTSEGNRYLPVILNGWPASELGTRKEGSVECIAAFPELLSSRLIGDSLYIRHKGIGLVKVWKGNPSYQTEAWDIRFINDTTIRIKDLFGYYEGKIVIQLINGTELLDENILLLEGGNPWIISKVVTTEKASGVPSEMVLVPGSAFSYKLTENDGFIPYPFINGDTIKIDSFLIDRYPVTNEQYYEFMVKSGYRPADTSRFLRHWQNGIYKQGQDNYPVVYLSYEDMEEYSKWAGKRLPTGAEWQLAAQGTDGRKWPWGNEFHGTYCNNSFDRPTPVDAFSKGQSPFGVIDMVGNVWQLTNDIYFNGSYYFGIIRGGSYFKPESSWWYLEGGPQSLDKMQMLIMVSPGFDRSPTVGFRCVRDIDNNEFRARKQR